jgi:N-acetyl-anhydromuramyl-L-alanine amidase AmpD
MFKCLKKDSEPDRPSSSDIEIQNLHPDAIFLPDLPKLKTVYKWDKAPTFYVLHYTAGWPHGSGESFMESFIKRGLCTDYIDWDGNFYQQRDFNRGGYHVGRSELKYEGKTYTSLSKYSAGVEIACPGRIRVNEDDSKWLDASFKKKILLKTKARYVTKEMGYLKHGWFYPYSQAQETTLARVFAFQLQQGVKRIIGHDDVSYDRRSDPGGSLSQPLQTFIKNRVIPLVGTIK